MKDWDDLVLETAERFGGTFPHPDTSQAVAEVYQRAPNSVERAIDQVADDYTAGNINSPWGILRSRVSKITADVQAKATASNSREKSLLRAEQWIRTTGIHFDRAEEIEDELYGNRGQLRAHPETKPRILELWNELRPLGVMLEQEAEERGRRYQLQHDDLKRALADPKVKAAIKSA